MPRHRLTRIARSIAAAVVAGSFAIPSHAQDPRGGLAQEQVQAGPNESLFRISLNNKEFPKAFLVLEDPAGLYLSEKDIRVLGIQTLPPVSFEHEGERFCSLNSFPSAKLQIDRQTLLISLEIDPVTLEQIRLRVPGQNLQEAESTATGALLTYNLFATGAGGATETAGTLEAKVLTHKGIGSSSYSLMPSGSLPHNRRLVRLDSSWRIDMPSKVQSLNLGDGYQRIGGLGQSVRFAGLSFGTDFDLQPGLISSPMESASGIATLPSIVDVYVNQRLTSSHQVPPGPFSVSDIPVISGTGELTVVVRDMQGREQVISRRYQVSQNLLAAGRSDYSIDAGFARKSYGLRDFDYGPFTSSVYLRHGFTNRLTAEARAYHVGRDFAGGVGALASTGEKLGGLMQLRLLATQTAGDAVGSTRTFGSQVVASYARQQGAKPEDRLTYQVEMTRYSRGFKNPGSDASQSTPASSAVFTAGYRFRTGQITASYIARRDHSPSDDSRIPSARIGSISYMFEALGGFATVAASKAAGSMPGSSVYVSLTLPLSKKSAWQPAKPYSALAPTSFAADYIKNPGARGVASASVSRDYPAAEGIGYRLTARDNGHQDADALWARSEAAYTLQLSRYGDRTGARAGILGTVGAVGGHLFASRPIDSSFAVVEIGNFANVPVYRDNNLITHTDATGTAIVPGLLPYVRNTLSTDASAFPIGTKIDSLDSVVVPYAGGASLVHFAVKRVRSASMTVVDKDGKVLPAGSIMVDNTDKQVVVGFDGQVYIADLDALASNNYQVSTASGTGRCTVRIPVDKTSGPISDLGEVQCLPSR